MSCLKTSLLVFSLSALFALSAGAAEQRFDAPVDMVVGDSLNVRSSPAIAPDNVMGMLGTGTEVQALGTVTDEEGNQWVIIIYNDTERYVSGDFVTPKDTDPEEETEAANQADPFALEMMPISDIAEEPEESEEREEREEPQETAGPALEVIRETVTEETTEAATEAKKSKKKKAKETKETPTPEAEKKASAPEALPTLTPEPVTEGTTAYVRQTSTYANGEVAGPMEEKTIVKTEDVPNLKDKGHGYVFTTYSNGSIEVMVY